MHDYTPLLLDVIVSISHEHSDPPISILGFAHTDWLIMVVIVGQIELVKE